jgi:hypothetical protein
LKTKYFVFLYDIPL